MAINAYCGLMGSGKSYEAVSSLILPAIAAGRRVISNIDGLNEKLIREYILKNKGKFAKKNEITEETLGEIILVDNERVMQPLFFPDPERHEAAETVVRSGDFVVIDEAWRFWPTSQRIPHEHMQFFRMHRHYAHPDTGVTCDIALLIQDISGLHLDLRKVIEMSVRTTKLKSVGLNNNYRVEVYEGYRQTKTARTASYQKRYNKKIFPLYQSYTTNNARETTIDSRQNIFKGGKVWFLIFLISLMLFGGSYYVYRFFNPNLTSDLKTDGSSSLRPESKHNMRVENTMPSRSTEWRIVGVTFFDERPWVVLQNSAGRLRYAHRSNFEGQGPLMRGVVDGVEVTTYSGTGSSYKSVGMNQ